MKFLIIYFEGTENDGLWKKVPLVYSGIQEVFDKRDKIIKSGMPAYVVGYTDFIENGFPDNPPVSWDFDKKEFKKESE